MFISGLRLERSLEVTKSSHSPEQLCVPTVCEESFLKSKEL
jgi:hypothetical protein